MTYNGEMQHGFKIGNIVQFVDDDEFNVTELPNHYFNSSYVVYQVSRLGVMLTTKDGQHRLGTFHYSRVMLVND